jgi:hypothetical protein
LAPTKIQISFVGPLAIRGLGQNLTVRRWRSKPGTREARTTSPMAHEIGVSRISMGRRSFWAVWEGGNRGICRGSQLKRKSVPDPLQGTRTARCERSFAGERRAFDGVHFRNGCGSQVFPTPSRSLVRLTSLGSGFRLAAMPGIEVAIG